MCPKMIFVWMFSYLMYLYTVVEKCVMKSFLFFYKKYVLLHAIFLLIQDSPFILGLFQ